MVDDAQTHRLPADRDGVARLAVFLGYADADAFVADLRAHLASVERHYADVVLSRALPLSTEVLPGGFRAGAEGCIVLPAGSPADSEVELRPGLHRVELAPGDDAVFKLRRFAEGEYPVATEPSPGGSATLLRIPRDEAPNPWYLHVEASQLARVCAAR